MMKSITLDFKVANCQYRCQHCDGAKNDRCDPLPLEKIKAVAGSFMAHKESLFENFFVFISDSAFLYEDFPALVDFLNRQGIRYQKEPIDGVKFDKTFFKTRFPDIAQSDLDTVRITLFGLGTTHDQFAGHKNSFNELMAFAKAFSSHGKHLVFHLYITPSSLEEMDGLKRYLLIAFPDAVTTYEYSNCYPGNYRRRHRFLLDKSRKSMAEKWNLSLASENEFAESLKGKRPVIEHNHLWIRAFGNGDCRLAVFPLGAFYDVGNFHKDATETIILKSLEQVDNIEKGLPSYDRLMDQVFDPDDPFLYMPSDALNLWWARYSRDRMDRYR